MQEKIEKIQELNFSKQHLTELLVECENKNHNLEVEKDSFMKHCGELKDERNVLKDFADKISKEFKILQEKYVKENQENKQKLYAIEEKYSKLEEVYTKSITDNNVLKQQTENYDEKLKNFEMNFKSRNSEFNDLEIKYNNLWQDFKVCISYYHRVWKK